jgi:Spy/CpxP family protein refolding chaperone
MNGSLRWKLILAFALVFLAGGVCGFFFAVHGPRAMFFHRPPAGSLAGHMKEHLRDELKLTSQQVEQVSPIIERATAQLEAKREQTSLEVREIFERTHREISPLLTAEQRARLGRMEERHRDMMHHRGLVPPGPPPPEQP